VTEVARELESMVENWGEMVNTAMDFLVEGDEIGKRMEVVGEEGTTIEDMVVYLKSVLFDFAYLQQNAFDKEDAYCPLKRQVALFRLIYDRIFQGKFHFKTHDEARECFLELQNSIKNMNFMPFEGSEYNRAHAAILEQIEKAERA
jgi:V/A-type H+-transporting ATPase subunit A